MSLINESSALEALGGDKNLLVELARMFAEDAPNVLSNLKIAMDTGERGVVHSEIHLLKGLVSTFFARPVVELAQRLEDAAAAGNLEVFLTGGFDELQGSVKAMVHFFRMRGWVASE